ncbi:hypothetical protein E4U09_003931 [Claviceps aff. purpurea]|uniref:Selenoprotein domain protein n=1 Tax=Claviceps aff. purpurea TaxID=1967640 RepID=A0A9P7U1R0_9HYPO|nr:hypothetical protein E4U09_003931 [Claviceps aff. purpurea]
MDAQERFPRVTIQFCTQCRWMLRAAYYAQELLSTFSTSLGQVSLQPSTGGIFTITIQTSSSSSSSSSSPDVPGTDTGTDASTGTGDIQVLWDRKRDGGFPEVKDLKRRVRDVVEPGRNLGHVDRDVSGTGSSVKEKESGEGAAVVEGGGKAEGKCEDCV